MKNVKIVLSLIIVCILFNSVDVFASTKVNIRTEDDYLVPNGVIVTESNRDAILSTPAIDASEKIYDFAEVLTEADEEKLYNQIIDFINETSMDLVIVTIKSNPVDNTEKYAHNFYNYNFFKKDGALLLIDFEQGGIYMTTNGEAHGLFPDSRIQPVLASVYKKILEKDYYNACFMFINSVRGFVGLGEAEAGEDVVIDVDGTVHKESRVMQALIFALIGTVIVMLILVSMNKMVKPATSSRDFLNRETMIINGLSDKFIGTNTTKRKKTNN